MEKETEALVRSIVLPKNEKGAESLRGIRAELIGSSKIGLHPRWGQTLGWYQKEVHVQSWRNRDILVGAAGSSAFVVGYGDLGKNAKDKQNKSTDKFIEIYIPFIVVALGANSTKEIEKTAGHTGFAVIPSPEDAAQNKFRFKDYDHGKERTPSQQVLNEQIKRTLNGCVSQKTEDFSITHEFHALVNDIAGNRGYDLYLIDHLTSVASGDFLRQIVSIGKNKVEDMLAYEEKKDRAKIIRYFDDYGKVRKPTKDQDQIVATYTFEPLVKKDILNKIKSKSLDKVPNLSNEKLFEKITDSMTKYLKGEVSKEEAKKNLFLQIQHVQSGIAIDVIHSNLSNILTDKRKASAYVHTLLRKQEGTGKEDPYERASSKSQISTRGFKAKRTSVGKAVLKIKPDSNLVKDKKTRQMRPSKDKHRAPSKPQENVFRKNPGIVYARINKK